LDDGAGRNLDTWRLSCYVAEELSGVEVEVRLDMILSPVGVSPLDLRLLRHDLEAAATCVPILRRRHA
jgi:hypothetical protein